VRAAAPARALAALVAALLAAGSVSRAEERSVEGIGAVPVPAGSHGGSAREAALRAAIAEAVREVAFALLPHLDAAAVEPAVDAALGPDPRHLASRFRILEDRGEGPALLVQEPGVETEYVMVVQAQVDVARVRERLERAGLLAPAAGEDALGPERLRVVIEDLDGYAAYTAVRTLLDELGVRGALPVELERGRAVLEVATRLAPEDLLASLVRSAPPELRIEPLAAGAASISLRAHFVPPPLGGSP
jgi:hypothetical protein